MLSVVQVGAVRHIQRTAGTTGRDLSLNGCRVREWTRQVREAVGLANRVGVVLDAQRQSQLQVTGSLPFILRVSANTPESNRDVRRLGMDALRYWIGFALGELLQGGRTVAPVNDG